MTAINPWIGNSYWEAKPFGRRVLVLGESHYDSTLPPDSIGRALAPGDANETVGCVQDLAIDHSIGFFTRIAKLLLGTPDVVLSRERRAEVWHGVAFANYVQWMFAGPKQHRPTEEMWTSAREPLLALVGSLQPDVLLVLGKEMSSWLPTLPSKTTVVTVKHPSSVGWEYAEWQEVVDAALGRRATVSV